MVKNSYRVTMSSSEFGYEQYDYNTKAQALAGLQRLANRTLSMNDDVTRTFTIYKQ